MNDRFDRYFERIVDWGLIKVNKERYSAIRDIYRIWFYGWIKVKYNVDVTEENYQTYITDDNLLKFLKYQNETERKEIRKRSKHIRFLKAKVGIQEQSRFRKFIYTKYEFWFPAIVSVAAIGITIFQFINDDSSELRRKVERTDSLLTQTKSVLMDSLEVHSRKIDSLKTAADSLPD